MSALKDFYHEEICAMQDDPGDPGYGPFDDYDAYKDMEAELRPFEVQCIEQDCGRYDKDSWKGLVEKGWGLYADREEYCPVHMQKCTDADIQLPRRKVVCVIDESNIPF